MSGGASYHSVRRVSAAAVRSAAARDAVGPQLSWSGSSPAAVRHLLDRTRKPHNSSPRHPPGPRAAPRAARRPLRHQQQRRVRDQPRLLQRLLGVRICRRREGCPYLIVRRGALAPRPRERGSEVACGRGKKGTPASERADKRREQQRRRSVCNSAHCGRQEETAPMVSL